MKRIVSAIQPRGKPHSSTLIRTLQFCGAVLAVAGACHGEAEDDREYRSGNFQASYMESSIVFCLKSLFENASTEMKAQIKQVDAVCAVSQCEHSADWFVSLERYEHGWVGVLAFPTSDGIRFKVLPTADVSSKQLDALFKELTGLRQKAAKEVASSPQASHPCKVRVCAATEGVPTSFEIGIEANEDVVPHLMSELLRRYKDDR